MIAPPRMADWLLRRFASGPKRESLMGDLHEQYQRGRSVAWYWRQALGTIATTLTADAWRHKALTAVVIALGISLPRLYMLVVWPAVVVRLDGLWYPYLIESRWSWMAIDPWAYRLQPYLWTGRIVWCALLTCVAWALARWRPPQHILLLTVFLVTQVGLNAPGLQFAAIMWLHAPSAMRTFGLLGFLAYTIVAIPAGIVLGGVWIPALSRCVPVTQPPR